MKITMMLRLLRTLDELRAHETWTRPQLESYQAQALHRLREHAYASSPFYQKFHQGLTERPLEDLPVLTKSIMMEHFDELVTDRGLHLDDVRSFAAQAKAGQRLYDRYWVNATSGSSGHPGFLLFDEPEWLWVLASFARAQEWSGLKIDLSHRQRMATVASISPWHMSSQVAATVQSWWRPSMRVPASQPVSDIVEQLNAWRPEVLVAYASMARVLAEEQLAGRLHIQPKVVYPASEVLTNTTRQRVRAAWGDEPFNQYVATEAASIAAEHRASRRMHLFEDLVIAEVVDEQYRPVPPGEFGAKVLVTTLFSRTQPLIRYELNDSIRLSANGSGSSLPFAVVDAIQGRVEDTLTLPSASGGQVTVRPLVFNRVMDILPVSGWQVEQQADRGLVVLISGARDGIAGEALVEQLTRSLSQEGAAVPYIRVEQVAGIPRTSAGKAPLVKAYRPAAKGS